jgi:hypothetical protein
MAPSPDESAVNWPEVPAYSYHGLNAPWIGGGMFMTFGLFLVAVAGYMAAHSVTVPDDHSRVVSGSTEVAAIGVFVMIAGILYAWGIPRLMPAIALSADGVFAYLKGKPWRFIGWGDVVSVARVQNFKGGRWLQIEGPRYTIRVYGSIDRYTDLCECLDGVRLQGWEGWSKSRDPARSKPRDPAIGANRFGPEPAPNPGQSNKQAVWFILVVAPIAVVLFLGSHQRVQEMEETGNGASLCAAKAGGCPMISTRDAAKHWDEVATVCGTVTSVIHGRQFYFDEPKPGDRPLFVAYARDSYFWHGAPLGPMLGKRICVTGEIGSSIRGDGSPGTWLAAPFQLTMP